MSNFDELYNILQDKLLNKCIADINQMEFEYYGEIVTVEFRYSDKMFYVIHVKNLKGELDYGYPRKEMELYNWLLRENPEICTLELEKSIFMLS